ncbi:hypothetical protein E2542_SST22152 [Spatholobus suberectus]|nr:hypothetical protein E2542_SST22152 [Spatholobus suberectus]
MVGSLGKLYESVENLDESYMQPNQRKDVLLQPRAPISSAQISTLLPSNSDDDRPNFNLRSIFYNCPYHHAYVTCDNQTRCQYCMYTMSTEMRFVGNKPVEGIFPKVSGFVKEAETYMVMDDLAIQPMSNISSIMLLNKFEIKEFGVLQEKVVELGMTKGVNLLKASLESKMVLTNVFLKNNMGS